MNTDKIGVVTATPGPDSGTTLPSGPFAELLREHRSAARLSQRELAERCQLSERAVRDLERGVTIRPRLHTVRALADTLRLADEARAAFVAAADGAVPPKAVPPDPIRDTTPG